MNTTEKVVALTFDDGPVPGRTERILKALDETGVKATFFLEGELMRLHAGEAKAIAAAGHQIGNHSYTHNWMVFRLPSSIRAEINDTNQVIRDAGYTGDIVFRPPFGVKLLYLPYYLKTQNIPTIMWDVAVEHDPDIAADINAIVAHTVAQTRPGSIILLHPMNQYQFAHSIDAIKPIVEQLKNQGYTFVTVNELLQR